MEPSARTKKIALAILGCFGIAGFFLVVKELDVLLLLKQYKSQNEIAALAEEDYESSIFSKYELTKKVEIGFDRRLSTYLQLHANERLGDAFIPVGYWEFRWTGNVEVKKEAPQEVEFRLRYDFDGNLIELRQSDPSLQKPPNYKESQALAEAKFFLAQLNVDTLAIEINNKSIHREGLVENYEFEFAKASPISPDLTEKYTVEISGRNIVRYLSRLQIDSDKAELPASYRTSSEISIIVTIVIWAVLAVFMIVFFFKRLRHDELEFRRAFRTAVIGFMLLMTSISLTEWPNWQQILLPGIIFAAFVGAIIFIVYSVSESLNRDVWPKNVALIDILSRGFFRVQEFGAAILDALFLSGVTLMLIAFVFLLIEHSSLGYLSFDSNKLYVLTGLGPLLTIVLEEAVLILTMGLLLFAFWPAYLKSKISNKRLLVLVFGAFLLLSGLQVYEVRPAHAAVLLLLPSALLWAYFAMNFSLLATLLSLFILNLYSELVFITMHPAGLLYDNAIFAVALIVALFTAGTYFSFSPRRAKDFEYYVPAYVGRIAERARIIKELEIARTLQMKFLPQTVPSLPALDIACVCRPAMEVGGDYYDFIVNGDGSLGVIIGDVSGKGVSAAFYMTMAKGIIKTLCKTIQNPKHLLSEMNTIFYENVPKEVFISILYGHFDLKNRRFVFARAGHNPLMVNKKSANATQFIIPKGLAIGLTAGRIFTETIEEITLQLEREDTFIFYTDGISESMNKDGVEFGEDRLQRVVDANGHKSAANLLDAITHEVGRFAGKVKQHDDLTMVVVKVGS